MSLFVGSALSGKGMELAAEKFLIKLPGENQPALRQWRQTGEYTQGETGIRNDSILMKEIVGTAQWETENIQVSPGNEYVLSWDTKIYGDKFRFEAPKDAKEKWLYDYLVYINHYSWNCAAEFLGVKVWFFDKRGKCIGELAKPVQTTGTWEWKTLNNEPPKEDEGWINVWLLLQMPPACASMKIAYVFSSRAITNGYVMIKNVKMDAVSRSIPDGYGKLNLIVQDAKTGRNLPARITLWNEKEEYVVPEYAYWYEGYSGREKHFYCPQKGMALTLPAGKYRMVVSRGFDYVSEGRKLEVAAGENRELTVALRPGIGMLEKRWYGGDHHLHIGLHFKTDYPQTDYDQLMDIARAEGMNYIIFGGMQREVLDNFGKTVSREDDFIFQVAMEEANHIYGHTCLMNIKELDDYYPNGPYAFPLPYNHIKFINQHGGFSMAAHPAGMIPRDKNRSMEQNMLSDITNFHNFNMARTLPLTLLLGEESGFNIFDGDLDEYALGYYYKLLNMGWKVPVGGSTDTNMDHRNNTLGWMRTFVQAERLDFDCITLGYRQGKTFATSGPLVLMEVNGKGLGEEVLLPKRDMPLQVRLKAFSQWGLSKVELVFNGEVVQKIENNPVTDTIEKDMVLNVNESGWLACRIYGPAIPGIMADMYLKEYKGLKQFAHTSPVYIIVEGKKMRPKKDSVQFFTRWLDELEKFFDRVFALVPDGRTEPASLKPVPEPKFLSLGKTEYTKKEARETVRQYLKEARKKLEALQD